MKLVSLALLVLALGCTREANEAPPTAASKPVEVQPTAAATTAAAASSTETKMSCGDENGGGATCGEGEGEGKGCSQWDQAAAEIAARPTPTDAVWTTIAVEGMSCGGCERRVIANLGKVDGVLGVEADAELGQVRVAFAKGNDAIAADARNRIKALGYRPL